MATSLATFDYSELPADTKGMLIALAGQIKKGRTNFERSLFDLGKTIAEAHKLLSKHGQGTFTKWIELETGIENSSAYNYMYAWMRFHGFPNAANITAGAMYRLAAPSAPPEAAKEAEKLANKGQRITETIAKELLAKHKPESVSPTSLGKRATSRQAAKTSESGAKNASQSDAPDYSDEKTDLNEHVRESKPAVKSEIAAAAENLRSLVGTKVDLENAPPEAIADMWILAEAWLIEHAD